MGIVYLVGAGPGDPKLITLRGVECLRRADLVLYDYLVNPRLLTHVRQDAERICLGRHGHSRIWTQNEINCRLVDAARQGKTVVRLKSGDPAVFARGAEEAEHLAREQVPFEIVPGITAALAASSCAGIPVTHRDWASAVALVTGQENDQKTGSTLDYRALARFPGTIVLYMGVTTASSWSRQLIDGGMSPHSPVAIVRRCSYPDQQTIHCRLNEVAERMQLMRPPAIVMIGEVTQLAERLDWFTRRPLFGHRILVTRAPDQADELATELAELGADVFVQPAIQVGPPQDWTDVDRCIQSLGHFDWIVFSSTNGVRFFMSRLLELGFDARALRNSKIAVVGPATAQQLLEQSGLRADVVPPQARAEALVESLREIVAGQRILLVRASRGRDVLRQGLEEALGKVEQVVAYLSLDVETADPDVVQLLADRKIDLVTITSSAIARSLFRLFGERLKNCRLASISPITTAALRELGLEPAIEATEFTIAGLTHAILKACDATSGAPS